MADLDLIEAFLKYQFPEDRWVNRSYTLVAPGTYEYLVSPSKWSLQWLANRFGDDSLRRQIASTGVQVLSIIDPALLSFLPKTSTIEITVPETCLFELAVFGRNLKLIDHENGVVYTLPLEGSCSLSREVEIRKDLPDEINVPDVLYYDETFPFFSEVFHSGREPSSVIDDWNRILDGLRQLTVLHEQTTEGFVRTDEVIANAFDRLSDSELAGDGVVEHARQFLEAHPLPEILRRCCIHGDYQTGNLLISDGETYVLDWEDAHVDLCVIDLFSVFKRYSIEADDGGPLGELTDPTDVYRPIAESIAADLGQTAYGDDEYFDGLPVLYVVLELVNALSHGAGRHHFAYELLADVLDDAT